MRPTWAVLSAVLLAAPAQAGSLVTLETPRIVAEAIRIPGNRKLCWRAIVIGIHLQRPAHVSVRLNGQLVLSGLDGSGTFTDGTKRVIGRGEHWIAVDGDAVSRHVAELGLRVPFAVDARDALQRDHVETVAGMLESDLDNPPLFQVGRTFVRVLTCSTAMWP